MTTPTPSLDPVAKPIVANMDFSALEEFAVEFALTLAGLQEQDTAIEPLDAPQLVVALMAALSAYARTRADYDPDTDVTDILQLGVSTYAQALYASAAQLADELDQPGLFEPGDVPYVPGADLDAAVEDILQGETDADEDPTQ